MGAGYTSVCTARVTTPRWNAARSAFFLTPAIDAVVPVGQSGLSPATPHTECARTPTCALGALWKWAEMTLLVRSFHATVYCTSLPTCFMVSVPEELATSPRNCVRN